jgi:hypothetical protein
MRFELQLQGSQRVLIFLKSASSFKYFHMLHFYNLLEEHRKSGLFVKIQLNWNDFKKNLDLMGFLQLDTRLAGLEKV